MKKIILFLALILLTTPVAFGIVDITKVSIKDAVEIASKTNLDIQASRLNISIEKNNISASNRLHNPEFGSFFNMGKAGKGNPQELGLSQTIEIAKRHSRKNLAKSNLELVQRSVEYLEFDLRMDVREAYTNLLAKKSVHTTMKEQEKLLTDMLSQAEQMHKKGKVSEIDVLQAKLLLNQIITEVQSTGYQVKTALYEFNKVINSPENFYDTLEESFTADYKPLLIPKADALLPDFDDIADEAINNRYDIKIALQQIDVAEKELLVVMRKKIPDIQLVGGYSYQNHSQSENGQFKHGAFVGANIVNIPLLYRFTPEIKNAKLKLEQAHLNYASVENKALNDLRRAYDKFLIAQVTLKNYKEHLLNDSEELINASRKSYKEYKTDLTTLITMEESYRMISINYTYALANYYNAWNAFIREVNNEEFTVNEIEKV